MKKMPSSTNEYILNHKEYGNDQKSEGMGTPAQGLDFKLKQQFFHRDLLDTLVIAMKPAFTDLFLSCDDIRTFTESDDFLKAKVKMISQGSASAIAREKLVLSLNELLPEFITNLQEPTYDLKATISALDGIPLIIRLLAKRIQLFSDEVLKGIKTLKVEELQEWFEEITGERDDILCYLGFMYVVTQFDNYKVAKAKKMWLAPQMKQYTLVFFLFQVTWLAEQRALEIDEENTGVKRESAKKDKVIEGKKAEIAKLNERVNDLTSRIKNMSKPTGSKEVEDTRQALSDELEKSAALERRQLVLTQEFEAMRMENKQLHAKIVEMKELDKKHSPKPQVYNLMGELRLYLSQYGYTDELDGIIAPYFPQPDEMAPYDQEDLQEEDEGYNYNYYGYCEITDEGHFVIGLGDGGPVLPLLDIPEDLYIGQNQIVLVGPEGGLLKTFFYHYWDGESYGKVVEMAMMENGDGGLEVVTARGERLPCVNLTAYNLHPGRMVGLNIEGEVVRTYRTIKFNADYFLESALVRGQQVYALEKMLNDCLVVKEVPSGFTRVIPYPPTDDPRLVIEDFCMLFLKDGRLIKVFKSHRFYTSSHYYPNREHVFIVVDEKGIFFERSNGERRLLNYLPLNYHINSGDVIVVDEYMNFIEKQVAGDPEGRSLERVQTYKKPKLTQCIQYDASATEGWDLEGDEGGNRFELRPERVLIIGDRSLQQSYKMALFKSGYACDVVSGVEAWHKIAKSVRQSDVIVFVTDFAKHQHYYKFKEEFSDKTIIYATSEGANRIVALLNEKLGVVA